MKTTIYTFCLLFLSISFLSSCSSDDDSTSYQSETASKLIGSWKRTSIESNNGNGWTDITQTCDLDDIEEFSNDGTYIYYPGTNTCNSSLVEYGTWRLAASDSRIVFTYDGYDGEYESSNVTINEGYLEITHSVGDTSNTQIKKKYSKVN